MGPSDDFLSKYPQTCIEHGGLQRCWFTFVPKSLAANSFSPLVVDMHGWGGCAFGLSEYSGWKEKAEENGFFLAWPQGTEWNKERAWNAGTRCCGGAAAEGIDDVGFIRKVVRKSAAAFNVDLSRVYMAGHSNGCAMAQRMAAQSSDIVAAVACHAMYLVPGGSPDHGFAPVPIMEIHGTADSVVPGGLVGAEVNLEQWRAFNNCRGDAVDTDYGDYKVRKYSYCADATEVALVTLPGVGHSPFRGQDTCVDTTQLAWDFLKKFHQRSDGDNGDDPGDDNNGDDAGDGNTGDSNGGDSGENSTGKDLVSSAQGCNYLHLSVTLSFLLVRHA